MRPPSPGQALSGLLPRLYTLTTYEDFPLHVAQVLCDAIACDKCDYTEVDTEHGDFSVFVWPEPTELRSLDAARAQVMRAHPVMPHFLRTTSPEPRLISDFLSPVEYHRTALYGEFFAVLGVEDQLTVPVTPTSGPRVAAISLDRASRSFTDDERALLEMLHPHLVRAYANARAFTAALHDGREPTTHRIDLLSDREREILEHMAAGLPNAAIGQALGISSGTVRKHVERILSRLGVRNRTSAAVMYASAGLAVTPQWTAQLPSFL